MNKFKIGDLVKGNNQGAQLYGKKARNGYGIVMKNKSLNN